MKNNFQKGAIVVIVFIIMVVVLLLSSYFLSFSLWERKISNSQQSANSTYYIAEAGINEAIWKLKNDHSTGDGDSAWADDFMDAFKNPVGGPYWSDSFSHSFGGGTYTVSISNSDRAKGQIISTARVSIGNGKFAQRIIKTTVFKALDSPVSNSAIFTGGPSENIDINFSKIKISDGNILCNNNLNISWLSDLEVYDNPATEDEIEGQVLAANNILNSGSITSEAKCSKNYCTSNCKDYVEGATSCPPSSASVPIVDFDSVEVNSFKSRAQVAQDLNQCQILCSGSPCSTKCILTASEFNDLLWSVGEGGTLTINSGITYVTGAVELKGGKNLILNGTLLSDDNIYIGESLTWKIGGVTHSGLSQITVNRPSITSPSGILAKRKINFGPFSASTPVSVTGIIYANDQISINSVPLAFNLVGGIIGRKISFSSLWQWFNVTLDNDIILYGLGYLINGQVITPTYAPVIMIDHWEESY